MNRSSLSLVVSIAVTGAALVACTTDLSRAPSEEGVSQTTQGLRKCTTDCDEPSDPAPAPSHPKPPPTATGTTPPPPAPTNVYQPPGGTLPVLAENPPTCNGPGERAVPWTMVGGVPVPTPNGELFCWIVGPCPTATARFASSSSSSSGSPPPNWPICNGFSLVSQNYCSYGRRLACYPLESRCECIF